MFKNFKLLIVFLDHLLSFWTTYFSFENDKMTNDNRDNAVRVHPCCKPCFLSLQILVFCSCIKRGASLGCIVAVSSYFSIGKAELQEG